MAASKKKQEDLLEACRITVDKGDAEIARLTAEHSAKLEQALAAEKQQFMQDLTELQHRHAADLAERDATISDAESVLLRKEESISELEDKVARLQDRLTEELETLRAAQAAHADDRISEQQQKIENMENVISKGRLMVDKLKSAIAERDEQLEQASSVTDQLQDRVTQLQNCLEAASQKTDSVSRQSAEFEKRCVELQSRLQASHLQYTAADSTNAHLKHELQRAEETVKNQAEEMKLQQKKIEYYKMQTECLSTYDETMDSNYDDLLEKWKGEKKKVKDLKVQLAEAASQLSRQEAELGQLRHQNPSESELKRQLQDKTVECVRRRMETERLQDQFDKKTAQLKGQIDRLDEERQGLRLSIRRLEDAANVTYIQPARSSASAEDRSQAVVPLAARTIDYTEKYCMTQFKAENDRLNRENEKLNKKLDDFKVNIARIRKERDELREQMKRSNAENIPPPAGPLASSDVQPLSRISK